MTAGELRAALETALAPEGATEETPEGTAAAEATGETEETPSSTGAQDGTLATDGDEGTSEAQEDATSEGTDDVPLSLLDVDLSTLSAEARRSVIGAVEEQNKLIGKLMRERAEGKETAPAATTPTPDPAQPTEFTDEDLISALKLDMEDPYDANTAKVAVPLARQLLDLKNQVEGLATTTSAEQTQRYWESQLDSLEAENGKLPVDRIDLYEYAADNGIGEPIDAYWRVMGPARQTLLKAVNERKAAAVAEQKRQATGTRPRTTTPVEEKPLEAKTTRAAVAEAAAKAAKELGLDWGTAARNS